MKTTMESIDVLFNRKEEKVTLVNQGLNYFPPFVVNFYGDKIRHVDLTSNRIFNLNWIRFIPNLSTVVLDNNKLVDEAFVNFGEQNRHPLSNITTLCLNNNQLSDLTLLLKILGRNFPNLEHLSLLGNPLCPDGFCGPKSHTLTYDQYKNQITSSLNDLKFLDYTKVHRKYMGAVPEKSVRVLKFSPKIIYAKLKASSGESNYNPLPESIRRPGDHCGTFGTVLYKYVGKQSEGNRFILNKDL